MESARQGVTALMGLGCDGDSLALFLLEYMQKNIVKRDKPEMIGQMGTSSRDGRFPL